MSRGKSRRSLELIDGCWSTVGAGGRGRLQRRGAPRCDPRGSLRCVATYGLVLWTRVWLVVHPGAGRYGFIGT
jgi:hypothetical protein